MISVLIRQISSKKFFSIVELLEPVTRKLVSYEGKQVISSREQAARWITSYPSHVMICDIRIGVYQSKINSRITGPEKAFFLLRQMSKSRVVTVYLSSSNS